MQNRFGFKDFVFLTLFLLFIFVVFLEMKQIDNQGQILGDLKNQSSTQTTLLASISRSIENLGSSGIAPTTQSGANSISLKNDPFFAPLEEAEKMPGFARGDYLVDNFQTKLGGILTPYISHDLYSQWVQAKVFDSLLAQNPNTFEYISELARSYQVGEDGLTFTFQLRHGIRFSDGEPLTADDVIYTYNFLQDPKINAPWIRAYLTKIKNVMKTTDDEVVFKLSEPYFNTLNVISSLYILPKHFYSKFSDEQINENPGLVMGTGPYRMSDPQSWRPGQKIEVVRNQLYWGEPTTFDRLIFNEVEEESAQETMFRNGDLDVYRCTVPEFARLSKDPSVTSRAKGYAIDSFLNGYAFIAWNEKHNGKDTIFADKRLRKAMSLATDRQKLCSEIYLGYAKPISGPFWLGSPQADPSLQPLPYDPELATKMLADLGWSDRDNSGTLKNADGVPLQFRLTYATGNALIQRLVLFLKDNFAKAKIDMELDPQPWAVLNQRLEHRDFEAITLMWGGGDVEQDPYQEFDSSQMANDGDNFMSYSNPEFDKAVEAARVTMDKAKRMKLWQQADRILYDDQPYTFLYARQETRFIANRIQNVQRTKAELNVVDLWTNPIPWFVPKTMQKYKQP